MNDELDARAGRELERVHLHLAEVIGLSEQNDRLEAEIHSIQCRVDEYFEVTSCSEEKAQEEIGTLLAELDDSEVRRICI